MGTASTKKFFKNLLGIPTEESALTTSAGAADADRIPALNANGVLDASIINSMVESGGATDANKVIAAGADGRISETVLPVGVGPDVAVIVASENLAAGDFVNIYDDAGTAKARKADASSLAKEAHGFVKASYLAAANATIYFEGPNTSVTGQTPGRVFLSTTPGLATDTAPTGTAGFIVQRLGVATSATAINFEAQTPFVLA